MNTHPELKSKCQSYRAFVELAIKVLRNGGISAYNAKFETPISHKLLIGSMEHYLSLNRKLDADKINHAIENFLFSLKINPNDVPKE